MKIRRRILAVVGGMVLSAGWSVAQTTNFTITSNADTSIWESDSAADLSNVELQIWSNAGGNQRVAYIRFDTSFLQELVETNIVLTVFRATESAAWLEGDVLVYGLPDIVGNTTQDWVASTLNYGSAGDEIPWDMDPATQDINTTNLVYLGTLPLATNVLEGTERQAVPFTSPALETFVTNRWANGGLTTFLLVSRDNANLQMWVEHSTSPYAATLDVAGVRLPPGGEGVLFEVDADACVRGGKDGEWDLPRWDATLLCRSLLPESGDWREWVTYLRFDLTSVQGIPGTGTVFTIYRNGGNTFAEGQVEVYGLLPIEGNTDPWWDETTLSYITTGAEIPGTNRTEVLDRGGDTLAYLGTLPDSLAVGPVVFSSPQLDTFVRDSAGGPMTLILAGALNSNRDPRFSDADANPAEASSLRIFPAADMVISGAAVSGGGAGSSVVITWEAQPGWLYGLDRSGGSLTNWTAVATNILGESVNTYTDAVPVEAAAFYRVRFEGTPPPQVFLEEDFESGAPGWVVVTGATHQAGTTWEIGAPTLASGPAGAQDGEACAGINLADFYTANADVSLQTPVLDLTTAGAVGLSFWHWYDLDGVADICRVYVRDETGAEIPELADPILEIVGLFINWTPVNLPLPAEASGRTIRIEFRFTSDVSENWAGWYIDGLRVSE